MLLLYQIVQLLRSFVAPYDTEPTASVMNRRPAGEILNVTSLLGKTAVTAGTRGPRHRHRQIRRHEHGLTLAHLIVGWSSGTVGGGIPGSGFGFGLGVCLGVGGASGISGGSGIGTSGV
jgi:hypothetical protein